MATQGLRVESPADVGPLNEAIVDGIRGGIRFVLRTAFRVRCSDIRPLPEGPLILAPNHRSFLDPLVVGCMVDRRPFFLMHARYYHAPPLSIFYRVTRCIPVDDVGDNRAALRAGAQVLESGRVLGIFPEGTISKDGHLGPGQSGVAWLARRTGAPVYPVWITGTREALRKGSARLRMTRLGMRIGAPVDPAGFDSGRRGAEDLTRAVMAAIAALGRTV